MNESSQLSLGKSLELVQASQQNTNDLHHYLGKMLETAPHAPTNERLLAAQVLGGLIQQAETPRVGLLAVALGSLAEMEANIEASEIAAAHRKAGQALIVHAARVLPQAAAFLQACRSAALEAVQTPSFWARLFGRRNPSPRTPEEAAEDPPSDFTRRYGAVVGSRMPEARRCWSIVDPLARGCVAYLCRDREIRHFARSLPELLAAIPVLASELKHVCYIGELLKLLENERILVLHPALQVGLWVEITGIVDNFQFQTLLVDQLCQTGIAPELGGEPGPTREAVASYTTGPLMPSELAETRFLLAGWQALSADGQLSTGFEQVDHWIWGEAAPADIPAFAGTRVVLLGPPPYIRTWQAVRRFDSLAGQLRIVERLTLAEVQDWLGRLAASRKPA